MYQCKQCECKYPPSYKKCPSCGSTEKEREKFVVQDNEKLEIDSAFVVRDDTIEID